MKRDVQKMIKESKQRAIELVRYASPRNTHIKPTKERVEEILLMNIPYGREKPVITKVSVKSYSKNDLIKSARYKVETADGKAFQVTAYEHLKGRTIEEKEYDKTITFPSGLFNIFCDEIVSQLH